MREHLPQMTRTLKVAAIYFGLVFSAGFVLGAIRTIWVVPRLGVRSAELLESPLMLTVTILAARRVVRNKPEHPLVAGIVALAFLLIAELSMMALRHLSLRQYVANRDPISGSVYIFLLALFALMPAFIARRKMGNDDTAELLRNRNSLTK